MEDKIYKLTETEKNEFYTFWANYNESEKVGQVGIGAGAKKSKTKFVFLLHGNMENGPTSSTSIRGNIYYYQYNPAYEQEMRFFDD